MRVNQKKKNILFLINQVREALLVRHRHQHERRKENNMSRLPIIRSLAEIGRNHSSSKSKFHKNISVDLRTSMNIIDVLKTGMSDQFELPKKKKKNHIPKTLWRRRSKRKIDDDFCQFGNQQLPRKTAKSRAQYRFIFLKFVLYFIVFMISVLLPL